MHGGVQLCVEFWNCMHEYWTLPGIFFETYLASNKVAYCILYYIVLYTVSGVKPFPNGKHLIKRKIYMLHFVLKKAI